MAYKCLYHATTQNFSEFHLNAHVPHIGNLFGKGIYLVGEDEGSKSEFLKPSKEVNLDVISVNGSGYISKRIYENMVRTKFIKDIEQSIWGSSIFARTFELYVNGKGSLKNLYDILDNWVGVPEEGLQENKEFIQKLTDYFSDKKFKRSNISKLEEGKLLKVALLSEEHIVDGSKSLKESGYTTVNPEKVYEAIQIDKEKGVTAFLDRVSSYASSRHWLSEGNHTAHFERLELLKNLTQKLKLEEKDGTKDGMQLMKEYENAIKLADKLTVYTFLNTKCQYLTGDQEKDLLKSEFGIQGMYMPNYNGVANKESTWYIIHDPSVLHILSYKNKKTNWEWQPVKQVPTPENQMIRLNHYMR